jgi:signal transduction histidine kinase
MKPKSLRAHLFALVIATGLPLALFGVAAIAWSAWDQTRASERELRERAQAVAQAVRREIESRQAMLSGVAVAELIAAGGSDLERALRPLAEANGGWIMVFDAQGRASMNTLGTVEANTPDAARRRWIEETWETRQPRVSDLHHGRHLGRAVLSVFVPALRNGETTAVLALAWPPEQLSELLARQPLPGSTTAMLVDGTNRILASSTTTESLLGQSAPASLANRPANGGGLLEGVGPGGVASSIAYAPVTGTPWTVALFAPSATLRLERLSVPFALAGIAMILLGLAAQLAARLAGYIAQPVRALAEAADRIVAGEPVAPTAKRAALLEIAELERALVRAGANERARRSEEARRAAAEAASLAKDELLATVSHELRTPLQSISAWTRTLAARRDDPALVERAVGVIDRSVRQVVKLLDDLLDASRLAIGQARLEPAPVDLARLVRQQIEAAQPQAAQKELVIETDLPASLIVAADPMRLEQIVANLLGNAIKFTPTGGRIAASLRAVDGFVELAIADDGPGIATEALPHVFDRYWQAAEAGARPKRGVGLGLAIAKQLVELHGGSIAVASEGLGKGATFTVALPAQRSGALDLTQPQSH